MDFRVDLHLNRSFYSVKISCPGRMKLERFFMVDKCTGGQYTLYLSRQIKLNYFRMISLSLLHAKYPIMLIKRIERVKGRCVVIDTALFWFRSFISKKK